MRSCERSEGTNILRYSRKQRSRQVQWSSPCQHKYINLIKNQVHNYKGYHLLLILSNSKFLNTTSNSSKVAFHRWKLERKNAAILVLEWKLPYLTIPNGKGKAVESKRRYQFTRTFHTVELIMFKLGIHSSVDFIRNGIVHMWQIFFVILFTLWLITNSRCFDNNLVSSFSIEMYRYVLPMKRDKRKTPTTSQSRQCSHC